MLLSWTQYRWASWFYQTTSSRHSPLILLPSKKSPTVCSNFLKWKFKNWHWPIWPCPTHEVGVLTLTDPQDGEIFYISKLALTRTAYTHPTRPCRGVSTPDPNRSTWGYCGGFSLGENLWGKCLQEGGGLTPDTAQVYSESCANGCLSVSVIDCCLTIQGRLFCYR